MLNNSFKDIILSDNNISELTSIINNDMKLLYGVDDAISYCCYDLTKYYGCTFKEIYDMVSYVDRDYEE